MDGFLQTHPAFADQPRTLVFRADKAAMSGQKEVAAKAVDAVIADATSRRVVSDLVNLASSIGGQYQAGMLNPEIPADKLVGAMVDAALKIELSPWDLHKYELLMTSSQMVGNQEKGRALLEKVCADTPAEQRAAIKKRLTEQFDRQVKEYEEERKKRKEK